MGPRRETSFGVNRRDVLAGAAAISAVGLSPRPATAAEFTFKLGHDQPVSHPQNTRAVEAAAKIAEESGGRLVMQVFPNNQLGGDTQMLSQLRSGALELLQSGDNILANAVPSTLRRLRRREMRTAPCRPLDHTPCRRASERFVDHRGLSLAFDRIHLIA